jgi:hypothetical protein
MTIEEMFGQDVAEQTREALATVVKYRICKLTYRLTDFLYLNYAIGFYFL